MNTDNPLIKETQRRMMEAVTMIYQRMKKRHIQAELMNKYNVSYETTKDDYYKAKQYIADNHGLSAEDKEFERTVAIDYLEDLREEARLNNQYSAARSINRDILMLKGLEETKITQQVKQEHAFDYDNMPIELLQQLLKYSKDTSDEAREV